MTTWLSRRGEEMLGDLAEKSLEAAQMLRRRAAEARNPAEMAKLVRMAAKLESEARKSLALKARLRADRLGYPRPGALRRMQPPTPTLH